MTYQHPIAKPEPRKRTKGRKDRREAAVKKSVRAACVDRDGTCRVFRAGVGLCGGLPQWAHIEDYRRWRTRGVSDPHKRHCTQGSLMLCERHHYAYDTQHAFRFDGGTQGADAELELWTWDRQRLIRCESRVGDWRIGEWS